jgi:hypothetical protein
MADDPEETKPVEPEPTPIEDPPIVELPEGPEEVEYRGGHMGEGLLRRQWDKRRHGQQDSDHHQPNDG